MIWARLTRIISIEDSSDNQRWSWDMVKFSISRLEKVRTFGMRISLRSPDTLIWRPSSLPLTSVTRRNRSTLTPQLSCQPWDRLTQITPSSRLRTASAKSRSQDTISWESSSSSEKRRHWDPTDHPSWASKSSWTTSTFSRSASPPQLKGWRETSSRAIASNPSRSLSSSQTAWSTTIWILSDSQTSSVPFKHLSLTSWTCHSTRCTNSTTSWLQMPCLDQDWWPCARESSNPQEVTNLAPRSELPSRSHPAINLVKSFLPLQSSEDGLPSVDLVLWLMNFQLVSSTLAKSAQSFHHTMKETEKVKPVIWPMIQLESDSPWISQLLLVDRPLP